MVPVVLKTTITHPYASFHVFLYQPLISFSIPPIFIFSSSHLHLQLILTSSSSHLHLRLLSLRSLAPLISSSTPHLHLQLVSSSAPLIFSSFHLYLLLILTFSSSHLYLFLSSSSLAPLNSSSAAPIFIFNSSHPQLLSTLSSAHLHLSHLQLLLSSYSTIHIFSSFISSAPLMFFLCCPHLHLIFSLSQLPLLVTFIFCSSNLYLLVIIIFIFWCSLSSIITHPSVDQQMPMEAMCIFPWALPILDYFIVLWIKLKYLFMQKNVQVKVVSSQQESFDLNEILFVKYLMVNQPVDFLSKR